MAHVEVRRELVEVDSLFTMWVQGMKLGLGLAASGLNTESPTHPKNKTTKILNMLHLPK